MALQKFSDIYMDMAHLERLYAEECATFSTKVAEFVNQLSAQSKVF